MELRRFATDWRVGRNADWKWPWAVSMRSVRKLYLALMCLIVSVAVGPQFRPPHIPLHMDLFVALQATGKFATVKERIEAIGQMNLLEAQKKSYPEFKNYHFPAVHGGLTRNMDVYRLGELTQEQVQQLFLQGVPGPLNRKLKNYLPIALEMSERFQVDPFWTVAIMWTESHFNPQAVSPMKARGLMQIMPRTGQYLLRKMGNRRISLHHSVRLVRRPRVNIKLGVYYLKRLLRMFKGNYIHATVAYNMGPGWVRQRLRRRRPVGLKNLYLDKVQAAYEALSRPYLGWTNKTRAPFLATYVSASAPRPKLSWYDKKFALFPYGLPFDIAMADVPNTPSVL